MSQSAVSYEGLPRFDGYSIETTVGVGGFGKVFSGIREKDGRRVALKVIDADLVPDDLTAILNEVCNMSVASGHPHVISLLDVFFPPGPQNRLVVVLEWATGGTLAELIEMHVPQTEATLAAIVVDALLGLRHLHDECHMVHRDIKAANLMLDRDGVVKLSDFGSSGAITGSTGSRLTTVGTPGWIAPEVAATLRDVNMAKQLSLDYDTAPLSESRTSAHDNDTRSPSTALPASMADRTAVLRGEYIDGYRYEADIWSLGATVLELATGASPTSEAVRAVRAAATSGSGNRVNMKLGGATFSPAFVELLALMFEPMPSRRQSAAQLLTHPALAQARDDPQGRRITLATLAKALPQAPSPDAGDGSLAGSDDEDRDSVDYEASPAGALPQSAVSMKVTAEDEPSTSKTLTTTSWHMVNPALACLLRGKDVAVGTSLSVTETPSVFQRTRPLTGLRSAEARDRRENEPLEADDDNDSSAPSTVATLSDLLGSKSRPFSGLFSTIIAPSAHSMWAAGNVPDGARPPGDAATRQAYMDELLDALSDCEASVPGFSARFLTAALENASVEPQLSDIISHAVTRGVGPALSHVDSGAPPLGGGKDGGGFGVGGGPMSPLIAVGQRPGGPVSGAHGAGGGISGANLTVWVQNPNAAVPAARDPLRRAEVVITSAVGSGANGVSSSEASVEICSLLFETWKKDIAKAAAWR